jgi:hypothetical protein
MTGKQHKKQADFYSKFSDRAYATKRKRAKQLPPGFEYMDDWSDKYNAVYRTSEGKILIASRGTELKKGSAGDRLKDLGTDVLVAMGLLGVSTRFRQLDSLVEELEEQVGSENIILTGHSLGGSLVHAVGKKRDVTSFAFNPGSSPGAARRELNWILPESKRKHEQAVFHVKGDLLGEGDFFGPRHIFEQKGSNPHSLDNFSL